MTANDLEKIGFYLIKSYSHDEWYTQRFQKGIIQAEFTFNADSDKLETVDFTIDEIVGIEFSIEELIKIDQILNK